MSFEQAVQSLLFFEGGYKAAGDPSDPGGETNFGISKRSYPNLDIAKLTKADAIDIYKRDYWDKYQLGAITDTHVGAKVLDILVNMGESGGTKVVQRALNGCGVPTKEDGGFGLQTLANVNKVDALDLLVELRAQCAIKYARIIIHKPDEQEEVYERTLTGWMRRAVRP